MTTSGLLFSKYTYPIQNNQVTVLVVYIYIPSGLTGIGIWLLASPATVASINKRAAIFIINLLTLITIFID